MTNSLRSRSPLKASGPFVYDHNDSAMKKTLLAALTLTELDAQRQVLDPGGSGRTVYLPAESTIGRGHWFQIYNAADAAEDITVQPIIGYSAIDMATNPTATNTLTLGGLVFEFLAAAATVNSDSNIGVLRAATADQTLSNVVDAINGEVASATGILKADASAALRNNSAIPLRAHKVGTFLVVRMGAGVNGQAVTGCSLDLSTNPTTTDTVTIGADVYEFVTAGGNVASDTNIGVSIAGTAALTLVNFIAAINGTATSSGVYLADGVTPSLYEGTESVYAASYAGSLLWIWTAEAAGGAPSTSRPSLALSDSLSAAVNWSASNVNVGPAMTLADSLTSGVNWSATSLVAATTLTTIGQGEEAEFMATGFGTHSAEVWILSRAGGNIVGSGISVLDTAAPANFYTVDTVQGVADGIKAAIGGTSQGVRTYAAIPVLVANNDDVVTAVGKLDQGIARKAVASGSGTTGISAASAATANAVTGATVANSSEATGVTAAGAATGTGNASISLSGNTAKASVYRMVTMGALAAAGTNYHAQFAAGAAIDETTGITNVFPRRTAQIVLGVGGANPVVYTLDWALPTGTTTETITATGAGTYQGTKGGTLTRIRSDVNPGGTTDVQTGVGYTVYDVGILDVVQGIDQALETPASTDAPTGTIIPTTVPNAAHVYQVGFRTEHSHSSTGVTASDSGHTHAAGAITVTDAGHTHTATVTDAGHVHTAGAITVTDAGHTHLQS